MTRWKRHLVLGALATLVSLLAPRSLMAVCCYTGTWGCPCMANCGYGSCNPLSEPYDLTAEGTCNTNWGCPR